MSAVHVERHGAILMITLDRPRAGNAFDMEQAESFADAAEAASVDTAVRCVVLTGAGPMFCVGGDIKLFASGEPSAILRDLAQPFHRGVTALATMPKPLVVLVNGPAAGAGLSVALYGDVVIAARSAHFTAAYTAIGLTPDGGLTWNLPRLIGTRLAQEMILTNRRLSADEALAAGMITRVVDDADLAAAGTEVSASLAAGPTAALGGARRLIARGATAILEDHLAAEAASIRRAGSGSECREGLAAFLERRQPDFPNA